VPRSSRASNIRTPLGCAAVLFCGAAVLAWAAFWNHDTWQKRQEQIPRLLKGRATVHDKGITHREWRDSDDNLKTEDVKWIKFTCRIGDRPEMAGSQLTLSGSDEGWERFQKDGDYDAFFDPDLHECVLIVDETVGDTDSRFYRYLGSAILLAIMAVVIGVGGVQRARRRRTLPLPD
jgi:hypothetical protein